MSRRARRVAPKRQRDVTRCSPADHCPYCNSGLSLTQEKSALYCARRPRAVTVLLAPRRSKPFQGQRSQWSNLGSLCLSVGSRLLRLDQ